MPAKIEGRDDDCYNNANAAGLVFQRVMSPAVYRILIPEVFQEGNSERTIRVTLALRSPVRHTRNDYAGAGVNFRLVRMRTRPHFRALPQARQG